MKRDALATATPAPDGWLAYWSALHQGVCPTLQMACSMDVAAVTFLACDERGAVGRFDADEHASIELTHRPGLHETIVEALRMMRAAMMTFIAFNPPPWREPNAVALDSSSEDAA